jgi:hypothetical protein
MQLIPTPLRRLGLPKHVLMLLAVAVLAVIIPAYARADSVTNMTWHGGTIMPTSTTYAIFWLPAGVHYEPTTGVPATDDANDTRYENLIIRYFQDVGGSDLYSTAVQYAGSNGAITNSSTFGGSFVDTTAYPHAGTTADPLTKQNLQDRVEAVRSAQNWPRGLNAEYFIFTGFGIQSCTPSGSCSGSQYCAYHSFYDSDGTNVIWANMPDVKSLRSPSVCADFNVNGDSYADTEISIVSHEHLEAVTDPEPTQSTDDPPVYGGGWYDDVDHFAGENGDKCAYTFGITNDIGANIYMNGNPYKVQREWSNALGDGTTTYRGCALSFSPPDIREPVMTFSNTALPTTIAGNPSDSVNINLVASDPSNAEPTTSTNINTTLPSGLTQTGGSALSIIVGNVGVHDTRPFTTVVSPTGYLLDGTVLTVSSVLSYSDSLCANQACTSSSQDRAQPTITKTSTITVVNAQPTLNLPGAQTQDYHDPLSFGISASDVNAGDSIALSASGLPAGLTFTDNGNRTGTVSGTITAVPGVYTATFYADDHHHTTPVSGTVQITVTREETTAYYLSPTVVAQNLAVTLMGRLLEDGTTAPSPSGQTLTLSVGAQSCNATVDASGNAQCTIANVTVPQGPVTFKANFAGDTYYLPSSATASGFIFAFPSRGDFVLGDRTVATATPTTTVTWWASNWSSLNSLTGGPVDTSFKGFAATLTPNPPTCGGTWKTGPGNSPPPVSGIPAYMGTLVSSKITKSGNVFSGNITKIVVVKTNPGYDPSPGHNGTGKIVATYCG